MELKEQLKIIERLMVSTCHLVELRLQELDLPMPTEERLEKANETYQHITDLCTITKLLIHQVRHDLSQ